MAEPSTIVSLVRSTPRAIVWSELWFVSAMREFVQVGLGQQVGRVRKRGMY